MQKSISNVPFNRMHTLGCLFHETAPLTIFDVGANIGQTIEQMKKSFPNSSIFSFEPQPDIFEILKKNFGSKQDVTLFKLALSAYAEETKLYVNRENNQSSSSLNPYNLNSHSIRENLHPKEAFSNNKNQDVVQIQTSTLDSIVKKNNIPSIDILKIDTQGHEIEVLEGSTEMLASGKIKVIISECIFDDVYELKRDVAPNLLRILYENNFRLFDISHIYKNFSNGETLWADLIFINKNFDLEIKSTGQ